MSPVTETVIPNEPNEASKREPSWMDASNDVAPHDLDRGESVVSEVSTTPSTGERSELSWREFLGAIANLCSATLGAGILALPFAVYQAGLVYGLLLLLISGWATAASISLIVEACDTFGISTYEAVVEKLLGRKWRQVVEMSILIFCCGTAVGYVIAVGDIMERVQDVEGSRKHAAMAMVWLLAMLPLSCLRRVQSLQCASSVGVLSIGTLLLAATVHLFMRAGSSTDNLLLEADRIESFLWPNKGGISVLQACPIFFFAFSCQCNVAQIYDELPGPASGTYQSDSKLRTMRWVTLFAVSMCSLLYASISLVTIFDFGNYVQPNILSCYNLSGRESTLLHIAFLAMALAVVIAFPLNVFPARVSIIQMWDAAVAKGTVENLLVCTNNEEAHRPLLSKDETVTKYTETSTSAMERGFLEDPLAQRHEDTSSSPPLQREDCMAEGKVGQHVIVTLLITVFALVLALVLPNISVVFGLLGGTTSSLLGFVVPGLLGLKMNRHDYSAWILVIAGAVIGIVTTAVTIFETF